MSKEYVLITTLSHFKLKYAIPREDFDNLGFSEPLDTDKLLRLVSGEHIQEFSQAHLGEVVSDVSVYTEEDMLTIFDIDNAYLKDWSVEQKLQYLNKWKLDETPTAI
jgi:hypothetical protein